jgi:hemoglobin-like flavoprotein
MVAEIGCLKYPIRKDRTAKETPMALDVPLLRQSFDLVVERQPEFTPRFYEILFARYPAAKPLFGRNSGKNQAKMLQEALVAVMDHIEDASWLASTLEAIGAKHVDYRVTDEMYPWVGECLIAALAEVGSTEWTPAMSSAWAEAYGAITGLMLSGAARARAEAKSAPVSLVVTQVE